MLALLTGVFTLQALQILETLIIKDSDKLDIRNKQAVRYCLLKQSKLQRLLLPCVPSQAHANLMLMRILFMSI